MITKKFKFGVHTGCRCSQVNTEVEIEFTGKETKQEELAIVEKEYQEWLLSGVLDTYWLEV